MTVRSRTDLAARFEGGDTPPASDWADWLASQVLLEGGIHTLAAGFEVDLSIGTDQLAATLPATHRAMVTGLVVRGLNATSTAVLKLKTAAGDILASVDLTGQATTEARLVSTDGSDIPLLALSADLTVEVTTTDAARTCRLDVLGYFIPPSDP
jgi:hypothetical protein